VELKICDALAVLPTWKWHSLEVIPLCGSHWLASAHHEACDAKASRKFSAGPQVSINLEKKRNPQQWYPLVMAWIVLIDIVIHFRPY
jgi:hypothetical protein